MCEIAGASLINSDLASLLSSNSHVLGQSDLGKHKNSGPFHQDLISLSSLPVNPLEGISAGLSKPGQWFHSSGVE